MPEPAGHLPMLLMATVPILSPGDITHFDKDGYVLLDEYCPLLV